MLIDFDIKEKLKESKLAGKKLPAEYFDLGIAFWLLNPDEGDYSPENLSKKFLHKESAANKELYDFAIKKLKEYKLEKLFYDVEMSLMEVLADMELQGIKLKV